MTPKQWLSTVTDYGCVVTGRSDIQRHHVVGRKGKQNKISIGEWFVLPLWWELHDISSNHPQNVTHFRHRFTAEFGLQRDLFSEMVSSMKNRGIVVPSDEILDAIQLTKY